MTASWGAILKILHFNTFPYGGAAGAAMRIHRGLCNLDDSELSSQFYYRIDDRPESESVSDQHGAAKEAVNRAADIQQLDLTSNSAKSKSIRYLVDKIFFRKRRRQRLIRLHDRHLRDRCQSMETFSMAEQFDPTPLSWGQLQADIVHLHWIAFMADYPSFFGSIPRQIPLVWTLHDMNPFTGGCHYANDCQKFESRCGDCPQLVAPHSTDASSWSWQAKQKALQGRTVAVVSPCDWLKEKAKKSQVWPRGTTFHTIRYGLNLELFRPIEKMEARRELGLAADSFLIAFGAEDVSNPRKGFEDLCQCLRQIQQRFPTVNQGSLNAANQKRVEGLVFGSGELTQETGIPLRKLGYLKGIQQLRQVYSAADVVVVPSVEDNQPQVALEAMACEKPVIGRDAGGVPEIVKDGQTGLLASDATGLANNLATLIQKPDLTCELGKQARGWMEQEFEIGRQSQKYLELYRRLIYRNSKNKKWNPVSSEVMKPP